jgi:hypothetical protein
MNSYTASSELIEILTFNGFVEDTSNNYPEHAARLIKQAYDPHHIKRHFVFKGTREKLYLDYINIILPSGGSCYSLNAKELKSLIAFCKLSTSDRSILREERYHALSIPKLLLDVERAPMIYSKAVYKRAIAQFYTLSHIN